MNLNLNLRFQNIDILHEFKIQTKFEIFMNTSPVFDILSTVAAIFTNVDQSR